MSEIPKRLAAMAKRLEEAARFMDVILAVQCGPHHGAKGRVRGLMEAATELREMASGITGAMLMEREERRGVERRKR